MTQQVDQETGGVLLSEIFAAVQLKRIATSPPHSGTDKLLFKAASQSGMNVYFSLHQSDDPKVGRWISMTYPGRSYNDPDLATIRQIHAQLCKQNK